MPFALSPMPLLMGVLNVTPDSFFDGGCFHAPETAIAHARQMIADGAAMIDIGGESTRPDAKIIPIEQEIERIIPVIAGLAGCGKTLSIDSRNAATMRAAIDAGAGMVNDISALTHDPESLEIVKNSGAELVLMHMQGTPQTMQKNPQYNNVVEDVYNFLSARIDACTKTGIATDKIIVDPGIGFGKTVEHNVTLIKNLRRFKTLGCRVLVGVSRKSLIAKLSADEPADRRLAGSLAAAIICAEGGADILRVHDVAETRQALSVYKAIEPDFCSILQ